VSKRESMCCWRGEFDWIVIRLVAGNETGREKGCA
jgi:hypothetical protein